MLAAIQAGDQERYTRLKARQDLGISRAGVRLQTLRATEATGGVRLAELFKQRATISVTHYTDLLEEGTSTTEQAALATLGIAAGFHTAAAIASAVAAGIQGSYAAGLSAGTVTAALAPPVWASMSSSLASSESSVAAGLQTVSSLLSMQAGFERGFPFEGSGLDCRWTLRLPRPANPFDFATIGDVLMTIGFTALTDANLRSQVIAGLRPTTEVTLPLSLRGRYPDQWYQLHNRLDRTPPFRVTLDVSPRLLPPHLQSIQLSHVALLLAHDSGTLPEPITVDMLGRPSATGVTGTEAVVPPPGLASSRSNAQGWNTLPRDPVGSWVLQLTDEAATRDLFDSGQLNDVVLALSLSGRPHSW